MTTKKDILEELRDDIEYVIDPDWYKDPDLECPDCGYNVAGRHRCPDDRGGYCRSWDSSIYDIENLKHTKRIRPISQKAINEIERLRELLGNV